MCANGSYQIQFPKNLFLILSSRVWYYYLFFFPWQLLLHFLAS